MRQRSNRPVLLGIVVCLMTSACFGPDHPDPAKYEYLYIDGAFVTPHRRFPEGLERGKWQCYDRKSRQTYSCTFVRGGFEHYQYIFRERGS